MLKVLLRSRMEALLSVLTGASRTKKAQSKGKLIGFAVLMLLSLFSLGTLFARIFEVLAAPLAMLGLGWLYFGMAVVLSFGLMLVGNVILAKYQLFEARDNDLLLSMPIPPIDILLSRLFLLYVLAVGIMLPVAIPALLFWEQPFGTAGAIAFGVIFLLVLPLLNLALSSLLGWLVHLASNRARNKSLITLVITLAFLGIYMYFSFKMNSMLSALAANPAMLEKSLGSAAPVVWAGRAIAEGKLSLLGILLAIAAAAFALCLWLLSRTFIRTATAKGESGPRKVYVERTAKIRSPRAALLIHELRRLWSSSAYLLNGALGSFFGLAAAVYLLIKGRSLTASPDWQMASFLFQPLLLAGLCYMASLVFLTAPSISLEGKYLWLPKSLPVSSWEVLQAKLRLHMIIALPSMILLSVTAAFTLGYEGQLFWLVLLLPPVFTVFSGLLGLFENLRHPNFNWINETQAVKSGASVMLTMFIGMGLVLLPILACLLFSDWLTPELAGWILLALLTVLSVLLYLWIRKKGVKIFEAL